MEAFRYTNTTLNRKFEFNYLFQRTSTNLYLYYAVILHTKILLLTNLNLLNKNSLKTLAIFGKRDNEICSFT